MHARVPRVPLFATFALGAAALGIALALPGPSPIAWRPGAEPLAVLAFAVLFFVVERQGFVFRWREESTKVSLDEAALFVGILALPLGHVVLGVALSSAANQLLHKRGWTKGGFNLAQYATAAGAAAGLSWVAMRFGVPTPFHALVAPFVFAATTSLLVAWLFSRMEKQSIAVVFRERFATYTLIGGTLGASLGLVTLALWLLSPWASLAVIPLFISLRRFGHLSEWADEELKTHKRLASVSAQVAGKPDLDAVAERILDACVSILEAGEAQLTLATPAGPRFWRRGDGDARALGGVTSQVLGADGEPIGALLCFPKKGQRAYGERESQLALIIAGNVSSAAANARALQEAARLNDDLTASERRYRRLFETTRMLVHVVDENGRLVEMNRAAAVALGVGRERAIEGDIDSLLRFVDGPSLLERLRNAGEVRGAEASMRMRDGDERILLVEAKELDGAGARRYVVFSQDITPLKAMETELRESNLAQRETIRRLENLNRELEQFTLWTTHDMREPLRSIGTIAGYLLEDIDTVDRAEAKDMARRIHAGSERLKERVKALHAFSRVVQRDDAFEDVDLQAVVEDAVSGLEAKIRERGTTVILPRQPLPILRAQPHRIHQVVANLIENAIKYAGPKATVELGAQRDGDAWRVWVRDDGVGIPQSYHERIFQLFQRGPESAEGGSGAGLAIVKRIVEQHGGHVWVESEPGHGACFFFTLPSALVSVPVRAA